MNLKLTIERKKEKLTITYIVVKTNFTVRFTDTMASKKKGLKNMLMCPMMLSRIVGR